MKTFRSITEAKIEEKLSVSDGQQAWIDDFIKSDAPQFKGKSKQDRAKMAVAAFNAAKKNESVKIDEALEVKLRGGKVPVGQHRFKYDVDKSDKYIENSIKERDPKATVERKGKDLWVTASAQAHSSVIAGMRQFRVNGTVSESVELDEAKSKAGDALMAYAKKSGGIDKNDMMKIAGKLQNHAATGNPGNIADIAKMLKNMDTDPRDKVIEICMKNDPAMCKSIMRKAGMQMREGLEENANVDYKASSEKSQFGGYRAKLLNPQGKISYLGGTSYKTAKAAEGEAAAYRDGYFGGPGRDNERGADRMVHAYKQKHAKDLYKKESVDEAVELDERSPWGDLKVKFHKTFNKNYEKALKWMKDTGKSAADAERMFRGTDARELAKMATQMESVEEAVGKFTDKQIKMAYGILNDPRWKGGNMTSIVRRIEGIAKGLSSHPGVRAAIRRTNEETESLIASLIEEETMILESVLTEEVEEMAINQIRYIRYALEEIEDALYEEDADMPEWFEAKLTEAFVHIKDLHTYMEATGGIMDDEEDEDDMEEQYESTQAYADSQRKIASDRQQKMMKPGEMDKLRKIRAMLDKEKKK